MMGSLPSIEEIQRLLVPKLPPEYVPHIPFPQQSAFLLYDGIEAFYGGAAGGGKSGALLMGALQYADRSNYASLLLHRTFLQDSGQAGKSQIEDYKETHLQDYIVVGMQSRKRPELLFSPTTLKTAGLDCFTAPGNETFLNEAELYPNGPNDDTLDASALALIGYLKMREAE